MKEQCRKHKLYQYCYFIPLARPFDLTPRNTHITKIAQHEETTILSTSPALGDPLLDSCRNTGLDHLHMTNGDAPVHWRRDPAPFWYPGTPRDVGISAKKAQNPVCSRAKREHANALPEDSDATIINRSTILTR